MAEMDLQGLSSAIKVWFSCFPDILDIDRSLSSKSDWA